MRYMIDLTEIARALATPRRGIFAADESIESAGKRLAEYGIKSTPESRDEFRELFLGAPGVEEHLSGIIFFDETFYQDIEDERMPVYAAKHNIIPGIKVDQGLSPLEGSEGEMVTGGIIGLPERLAVYAKDGARFTKWRAAIRIDGDRLPSNQALMENARRLAAYAHAAQQAGLVPILEPEVLLAGNHSRTRARAVLEQTLQAVFAVLEECAQNECVVDHSGIILKTSMALSGSETGKIDTPEEVAEDTLAALMAAVPRQTAGIVFLSGGQTPDQATANLAAIARRAKELNAPWPLTFSYARALQEEALAVWKGKAENVDAAREVFMTRLKKVADAAEGIG